MSISYHSKSGPPIVPVDPAAEREKLITANQAFAAALKQALLKGVETSAGVLATVRPKRRKLKDRCADLRRHFVKRLLCIGNRKEGGDPWLLASLP